MDEVSKRDEALTKSETCALCKIGKSTLDRLIAAERFPKARYLSERSPRWFRSEVEAALRGEWKKGADTCADVGKAAGMGGLA